LQRIQSVPLLQQGMSVIILAELHNGVQMSSKKKATSEAVHVLTQHLTVHDWARDAAVHHAEIRADLKKKGQLIGANDRLIAAHARSLSAIVVTNNVKDFARVKGLAIENWMA
jgi:tRNA(fMet)-specific endonuclease VapC